MKSMTEKIIYSVMFLAYATGYAQGHAISPEANRYPLQHYYEDSVHVFWTQYPNPFGPPTVRDTGKANFDYPISFYCDLSDSVEIELLNEHDSVVYHAPIISSKPFFQLGYWIAGPKADLRTLPAKYFTRRTAEKLSWVIVVNGRRKSKIEAWALPGVGWHLWMTN